MHDLSRFVAASDPALNAARHSPGSHPCQPVPRAKWPAPSLVLKRGIFALLERGGSEGVGGAKFISHLLIHDPRIVERADTGFMLLKQSQSCAHDIAVGAITTRPNLFADELAEMIADRDEVLRAMIAPY